MSAASVWVPMPLFLIQLATNVYIGRQQVMAQVLRFSNSCGRPGWNSKFLAFTWPSPGCCRYLGSEPAKKIPGRCLGLSLSFTPDFSFLLMCTLEGSTWWSKNLGPCHSSERPGFRFSSELLVSGWLVTRCCRHLDSQPVKKKKKAFTLSAFPQK